MIKYLRREMLGFLLNIAGLFTVSGLQVYAALRMTKVAEYLIQQNTLVEILEFNEEKNQYYVKGYRKKGM